MKVMKSIAGLFVLVAASSSFAGEYPQLLCSLKEGSFSSPVGQKYHLLQGASLNGQQIALGNPNLPMFVGPAGGSIQNGNPASYIPNSVIWEFQNPANTQEVIALNVPASFAETQGKAFEALEVATMNGLNPQIATVACEVR